MSKINPIGVNPLPPAYHHAAAVYSRYSLADVLAFRWRTCGKLGFFDYCDNDRYEASGGLVSFADYLELRALRIAAQRIELEGGDVERFELPTQRRYWPFMMPLGHAASGDEMVGKADDGMVPPGSYLDVVL